jgi:hypothetical protein
MTTWTRYLLPLAGALAVTSGCATSRQGQASTNPAARQVSASQERSQQALDSARKAQQRASDQQQKAAAAQREVQDAQRRLAEAQRKAETETAKAQEAQRQANQATGQATREAQEAQQAASQQLANQTEIVGRGEQVLSGQVARATSNQIVLHPANGQETTFSITPDTRVMIDGRRASANEIVQGGEARVAYDVTGRSTAPTARSVQIMTGNEPARGTQERAPAPPADTGSR